MLFTSQEELDEKLMEEQPAPVEAPSAPSLLAPVMPLSPWEQAEEEYGTGEAMVRRLGNIFTGGLFDSAIIPEMGSGSLGRYKKELETYADQSQTYNMAQALAGIDPSEITPAHIAMGNEYGGTAFGEYLTDQFAAQQAEVGADHAVAELAGVPYAQWAQRSPEQKRADRNYYQSQNGDGAYFDAQLQAQGKAPEQVQASKESELYGSGLGQRLAADRETIIGTQSNVEMLDTSAAKIRGIREILEDNPDAAGWNRVFRDAFNMNTAVDGVLSEAEANGVVEQIKQATFGAISQAELDLLRQALMDPTKSTEFNIGTLSSALKTVQDKRKQVISDGRQAVDRYSANETQTDFETLMKSDWAYNNIGGGSRIQSIPAFGDLEEYTFQQYVEETMSSLGPFDPKPSRDDLINGFAKEREDAEADYEAMIEKQKADAEAARVAHERLQRPFGTKK